MTNERTGKIRSYVICDTDLGNEVDGFLWVEKEIGALQRAYKLRIYSFNSFTFLVDFFSREINALVIAELK